MSAVFRCPTWRRASWSRWRFRWRSWSRGRSSARACGCGTRAPSAPPRPGWSTSARASGRIPTSSPCTGTCGPSSNNNNNSQCLQAEEDVETQLLLCYKVIVLCSMRLRTTDATISVLLGSHSWRCAGGGAPTQTNINFSLTILCTIIILKMSRRTFYLHKLKQLHYNYNNYLICSSIPQSVRILISTFLQLVFVCNCIDYWATRDA